MKCSITRAEFDEAIKSMWSQKFYDELLMESPLYKIMFPITPAKEPSTWEKITRHTWVPISNFIYRCKCAWDGFMLKDEEGE